jgi:6-phosphogluconolactonase
MKKTDTIYGTLLVGSKDEIFDEAVAVADRRRQEKGLAEVTWALTGGSTPADFYRFCVAGRKIPGELLEATRWFTSDERMVPLESEESNFGNAARLLLDPLAVPAEKRFPWPVDREPVEAARLFNEIWISRFSGARCFDLCFLGMGDDCHTASIFPGSPWIAEPGDGFFAQVEVPGKGPRLTITRTGLGKCGTIVVMVTGRKKAGPLREVFGELHDPELRPIQLLRDHAERTVWLVDHDAASELNGA